jgi:hypothetical protein
METLDHRDKREKYWDRTFVESGHRVDREGDIEAIGMDHDE